MRAPDAARCASRLARADGGALAQAAGLTFKREGVWLSDDRSRKGEAGACFAFCSRQFVGRPAASRPAESQGLRPTAISHNFVALKYTCRIDCSTIQLTRTELKGQAPHNTTAERPQRWQQQCRRPKAAVCPARGQWAHPSAAARRRSVCSAPPVWCLRAAPVVSAARAACQRNCDQIAVSVPFGHA